MRSLPRNVVFLSTFTLVMGLTRSVAGQELVEIHRYTEADDIVGSVNSYLVETTNGIVIIDTQRNGTQGGQVAQQAVEIGKDVLGIFITHPHPDHIGGLAAVVEQFPDAPFYATQATEQELINDTQGLITMSQEQDPDFPDELPLPTNLIADGDTVEIDGVAYLVDEFGASESVTMTTLYLPDENILFIGDIVDNEKTPYLLEGRTEAWIAQIVEVTAAYSDSAPVLYPGHGLPEALDVLMPAQIGYLTTIRHFVSQSVEDGTFDDAERAAIIADMELLYPGYLPVANIPNLLELNLDALAEDIIAEGM